MTHPDVIPVTEVARRLGIGRRTVYARIAADIDSIPGAARIGRRVVIRRAPFERWLRGEGEGRIVPFIHRRAS